MLIGFAAIACVIGYYVKDRIFGRKESSKKSIDVKQVGTMIAIDVKLTQSELLAMIATKKEIEIRIEHDQHKLFNGKCKVATQKDTGTYTLYGENGLIQLVKLKDRIDGNFFGDKPTVTGSKSNFTYLS